MYANGLFSKRDKAKLQLLLHLNKQLVDKHDQTFIGYFKYFLQDFEFGSALFVSCDMFRTSIEYILLSQAVLITSYLKMSIRLISNLVNTLVADQKRGSLCFKRPSFKGAWRQGKSIGKSCSYCMKTKTGHDYFFISWGPELSSSWNVSCNQSSASCCRLTDFIWWW